MTAQALSAGVVTCPSCGRRNRVAAVAAGIPRCGNCHQPLLWIADADDDTFAEVAKAAHPLNGNSVAGTRGVTERVEGRYAGTYQRGGIF